jgi:hypothetical protein
MTAELMLPERRARELLARICEIRSNPAANDFNELFTLHAELERLWIRHRDIDDLDKRVAELEGNGEFEQAYALIDEIDARLREVIELRDDAMPLPEIDDLFSGRSR